MYHTIQFDDELTKNKILKNYKILLPFVGDRYAESKIKILVLGESQYLPGNCGGKVKDGWYDNKQDIITDKCPHLEEEKRFGWLDTRKLLNGTIKNDSHPRAHSIYRNTGNLIGNYFYPDEKDTDDLYRKGLRHISFTNYFLRPAENEGKSINYDERDEKESYQYLELLNRVLNPDLIFFVSKKSYCLFLRTNNAKINLDKIHVFPHPGSAWWNRESWNYYCELMEKEIVIDDNVFKISGKEKMDRTLAYYFKNP